MAGGPAGVVRVVDVEAPNVERSVLRGFIAAAAAANGQSTQETANTLAWRQREVERIAAGGSRAESEEVLDGSIA